MSMLELTIAIGHALQLERLRSRSGIGSGTLHIYNSWNMKIHAGGDDKQLI